MANFCLLYNKVALKWNMLLKSCCRMNIKNILKCILIYSFYFIYISFNFFHQSYTVRHFCTVDKIQIFIYLFIFTFLLLFNYSYLPFSSITLSCPAYPHFQSSPLWSCPRVFYRVPWWSLPFVPPLSPNPSLLVTVSLFFIPMFLVLFCSFVYFVD